MSIKGFKNFIAEGGQPAADFKAPKDDDKEATEYKPRSQGEQEFKDAHKIQSTKHPVAGDHQFDGSRDAVTN